MENKKRCFGLEQQWHALLGILSLVGAAGVYYGHFNFLWLNGLIGLALIVFAFTGRCGLRSCLCCMPWNKSCSTSANPGDHQHGGGCNHKH